jgi:hypothetical protein
MHAAGIATPFGGLLAFYGVEFLQNLDRDGEVIVLEFENRLWVVQQDVRIEDEGLYFPCDLELRLKGDDPAQVFHRCGYLVKNCVSFWQIVDTGVRFIVNEHHMIIAATMQSPPPVGLSP